MDGNNRWSKKNNKSLFEAYNSGAKKLISITDFVFKNYKCDYVSAFALSNDNLKRNKKRIHTVLKILEIYIEKLISNNSKINFNFHIIGDISILNNETKNKIFKLIRLNKNYRKNLIIFFNYSGSKDINITLKNNYKKLLQNFEFSKFLLTKDIPDPDILIRTGGYQRLSDFLLYQVRYTEFFFLKKLWPDLSNLDVKKCINKFSNIKRNYGN